MGFQSEGVSEAFVGEVVLAEPVDVAPDDHGVAADRVNERLLVGRIGERLEPVLEVQVVPANDGVLDEPVATFGDLSALLVGLLELAGVADGDVASEAMGELDAAQLLLDRLTQVDLVNVAQHEQRLDDLPERLERAVELVLLGVGADALALAEVLE